MALIGIFKSHLKKTRNEPTFNTAETMACGLGDSAVSISLYSPTIKAFSVNRKKKLVLSRSNSEILNSTFM